MAFQRAGLTELCSSWSKATVVSFELCVFRTSVFIIQRLFFAVPGVGTDIGGLAGDTSGEITLLVISQYILPGFELLACGRTTVAQPIMVQ